MSVLNCQDLNQTKNYFSYLSHTQTLSPFNLSAVNRLTDTLEKLDKEDAYLLTPSEKWWLDYSITFQDMKNKLDDILKHPDNKTKGLNTCGTTYAGKSFEKENYNNPGKYKVYSGKNSCQVKGCKRCGKRWSENRTKECRDTILRNNIENVDAYKITVPSSYFPKILDIRDNITNYMTQKVNRWKKGDKVYYWSNILYDETPSCMMIEFRFVLVGDKDKRNQLFNFIEEQFSVFPAPFINFDFQIVDTKTEEGVDNIITFATTEYYNAIGCIEWLGCMTYLKENKQIFSRSYNYWMTNEEYEEKMKKLRGEEIPPKKPKSISVIGVVAMACAPKDEDQKSDCEHIIKCFNENEVSPQRDPLEQYTLEMIQQRLSEVDAYRKTASDAEIPAEWHWSAKEVVLRIVMEDGKVSKTSQRKAQYPIYIGIPLEKMIQCALKWKKALDKSNHQSTIYEMEKGRKALEKDKEFNR